MFKVKNKDTRATSMIVDFIYLLGWTMSTVGFFTGKAAGQLPLVLFFFNNHLDLSQFFTEPIRPNAPFLYPLKTSQNCKVF